mmetsp:Transcript_2535/g.5775  ORF Transcript_2535/g.5775 Transcript_2535/m.5775 type:complete len:2039 (-) Transcript_2535:83-6199(-)
MGDPITFLEGDLLAAADPDYFRHSSTADEGDGNEIRPSDFLEEPGEETDEKDKPFTLVNITNPCDQLDLPSLLEDVKKEDVKKGTSFQSAVQKSTMRYFRQSDFPSIEFNYSPRKSFQPVSPECEILPDYVADAAMRKAESKGGSDLDEEDVKSLFRTASRNSLTTDYSFLAHSVTHCRKRFDEESKALGDDGLFWRYAPDFKYVPSPFSKLENPSIWSDEPALRVLFCAENLEFEVGGFEPMYCSVFVYDLRHSCRVSECFTFSFNDPEELENMMKKGLQSAGPDPGKKWCMFNLEEAHEELYLVFRVERVLQGESSQQDTMYLKGNSMRRATVENLQRKTLQTIKRLGSFRQPFCWGLLGPLCNEDGELKHDGKIKIGPLYFQLDALTDEQLQSTIKEIIEEQKRMGKVSQKIIRGGTLSCALYELDDRLPFNQIHPSGLKLKPPISSNVLDLRRNRGTIAMASSADVEQPLVQLVLPFNRPGLKRKPHLKLINTLYVQVQHCAFFKHRNVAVKVEIRQNDNKGLERVKGGESWIWTQKNMPNRSAIVLPVNYHNKRPNFYTEVKIQLPMRLHRQAHLFFTFYNVSCKKKRKHEMELIGYSVLPILENGQVIATKEHKLPVASKLPKSYFIPFMNIIINSNSTSGDRKPTAVPGTKLKFSGEHRFLVSTRVESCLFTSDSGLAEFLNSWPTEKEIESLFRRKRASIVNLLLSASVKNLRTASAGAVIEILPGLLDFLLEIIGTWQHGKQQAFNALMTVVHTVNRYFDKGEGETAEVLSAYVTHYFKDHSLDKKKKKRNGDKGDSRNQGETQSEDPLYIPLTVCWTRALDIRLDQKTGWNIRSPTAANRKRRQAGIDNNEDANDSCVIRASCFLFELVFKSMALDSARHSKSGSNKKDTRRKNSTPSAEKFPAIFSTVIEKCVQMVYAHRSIGRFLLQNVLHALGRFMVKLFHVMDDNKVLELAAQFMEEKDDEVDPVRVDLRANFMQIIAVDNPFIVDIMNPPKVLDNLFTLSKNASGDKNEEQVPSGDTSQAITALLDGNPFLRILNEFVRINLGANERTIREKVIAVVMKLFSKLDYDKRYQDAKKKSQIVSLFAPMLEVISENIISLGTDGEDDKFSFTSSASKLHLRNTLACALWILKNLDTKVRELWWKDEDPDYLADLLAMLELSLRTFEYPTFEKRQNEIQFDCILAAATAEKLGGENLQSGANNLKSNLESLYTLSLSPMTAGKGLKGGRERISLRERRAQINRKGGTWKRATGNNTLTTSSREYLWNILKLESGMAVIVSRVITGTLIDVLDFGKELIDPLSMGGSVRLYSSVLKLITCLVDTHQTVEQWTATLHVLHLFVSKYGPNMFLVDYLQPLVTHVVRALLFLCKWPPEELCKGAVSALYKLLRANFAATKDLERMQAALTVSMSGLVPHLDASEEESRVERILDLLPLYANEDKFEDIKCGAHLAGRAKGGPGVRASSRSPRASPGASREGARAKFMEPFAVLMQRLATILQGSIKVRKQGLLKFSDPTATETSIMGIANAFAHMPDIRYDHILRLAEFHKKQENFAEAGFCFLAMAGIAEEKLEQIADGKLPPDMEQQRASTVTGETETHLESCYTSACDLLDKAELYEECNRAYHKVLPLLMRKKKYKALSEAHIHLHNVFMHLTHHQEKENRRLGTYYRVGFYGTRFAHRDGKEFIYKKPKVTRLIEIVNEMRSLYSNIVHDSVEILDSSGAVDRAKLDPAKCVMQITHVEPYFDEDSIDFQNGDEANDSANVGHSDKVASPPRLDFISRHTNLNAFVYSTPFTIKSQNEGASPGGVACQCKRKTILKVPEPFPCCLTAQKVVYKKTKILNPLLSAIEDIKSRTERIKKILAQTPVSKKSLAGVLQGSVATQVNGGAVEICYAFLSLDEESKNRGSSTGARDSSVTSKGKYTLERLTQLRQTLRAFLRSCRDGLDAHAQIVREEAENKKSNSTSHNRRRTEIRALDIADEFQEHLSKSFDKMCRIMRPFLNEGSYYTKRRRRKNRQSTENRAVRFTMP